MRVRHAETIRPLSVLLAAMRLAFANGARSMRHLIDQRIPLSPVAKRRLTEVPCAPPDCNAVH
jgi:hypothetical protein